VTHARLHGTELMAATQMTFRERGRQLIGALSCIVLIVVSADALWPRHASTAAPTPPSMDTDNWSPSKGGLDLSARERVGVASFYASSFFGKTMADGAPMDPRGRNAASRTLPLGTVAKVTNVANGRSAIVQIEDRGPYVKGRIVDLSPSTAHRIGITERAGLAEVVVAPITVPLPGGGVRLGAAAHGTDLRLASAMPSRPQ
jgi:rare lipoprotein A